jgi:predicted SnoaL-like aldol condensation-catalyzing enzyme
MTSSAIDANRVLVLELIARFDARDIDAGLELLHPEFVSHNPRVSHEPATATGLQAFADFFRGPEGQVLLEAGSDVRRIIADDPLVAIHNRIALPGGDVAAVDIFRIQDGLVAEHWDVVQPVPERAANPHGMF